MKFKVLVLIHFGAIKEREGFNFCSIYIEVANNNRELLEYTFKIYLIFKGVL